MMLDKIVRFGGFRNKLSPLLLLALMMLVSACSNKVVVKGNIPQPLVERVPLTGVIRYTEEFRNYVYNESEKKRALKSLDFTEAQMVMFDRVFGGLMNVVPESASAPDLTIEPEILEIQYTAPSETKLNQYEVWIKYRIKLRGADDQRIADWIIKGYGKTPTALLGSAASGFNSAANVALRDVGAQLSIGFPKQSKIKALVSGSNASQGAIGDSSSTEVSNFAEDASPGELLDAPESDAPATDAITNSEEPES